MRKLTRFFLYIASAAAFVGCDGSQPVTNAKPDPKSQPVAEQPATPEKPADGALATAIKTARLIFAPLPEVMKSESNPISDEKIELGRMLFYDKRLSKNQDISCNSCHLLDKFGVDGKQFSTGHKNQKGGRNAPTVYNAGLHIAQFWDGRAKDLEEQAKGPVLNPIEMAMPDEKYVLTVLKSISGYVEAFKKTFPDDADPVSYDNMAKAIGAFERKLVTPGRYDKFLAGDDDALTVEEKQGLQKFVQTGCIQCHMGPAVGGALFQKLGLIKPWPNLKDEGRYEATKNEA